ncbi:hypothetical protein [Veronia pacifica]|nr:hypothetical protein [Veronia pacifica]
MSTSPSRYISVTLFSSSIHFQLWIAEKLARQRIGFAITRTDLIGRH